MAVAPPVAGAALEKGPKAYKALVFDTISFPSMIVGIVVSLLFLEITKDELLSGAAGAIASTALFMFLKSQLNKPLKTLAKVLE